MVYPWDSPLHLLRKIFSCHFMKSIGLTFKPVFHRRLFDDIFDRLESAEGLSNFVIVLIIVTETCLFSLNKKKNENLSFLDIKLSQKKNLWQLFKRSLVLGVYAPILKIVANNIQICDGLYSCLSLFPNFFWLGKVLWRT